MEVLSIERDGGARGINHFLSPNVFMHSAHRGKLTLMWILVQRLLMLFGRMQAFFFHFLILLLPFLYFHHSLSLFPTVPQTSSSE